MRPRAKPSRILLALICAVFLPLCACKPKTGFQIGDGAPGVTLADGRGKPFQLPGGVVGKTALIKFWAMDCHFCDKESLIQYEALYQKYKDRGFMPVAIEVSRPDSTDERSRRFEKLTYPMLVDETGKAAKLYGVVALPVVLILDEKGILREKIVGEAKIDEIERLMTKVLYKEGFYYD